MKRSLLLLLLLSLCIFFKASAQTEPAIGPAEQKMTTALCDCISKLDQSKIKNSEEANKAFMECFMAQADILIDVTTERKVDMDNDEAMNKIGADIGKNLMKQKCDAFLKLAVKMSDDKETSTATSTTNGTFKRIETKGFNYIVVNNEGSEKSFLWLREFKGSDKFTGVTTSLLNKKLKITWQEMEVYLPAAKGYYKVKEITAVEVL